MRRLAVGLTLIAALAIATIVVVRTQPVWYERLRYPLRYDAILRSHATTYRLDPAFLAAVVYTESKFDPNAKSTAGALGLMQLLPDTAKGIALRTGGAAFVVSDLYDPEINVRYGSWYLRHLLDRYGDEETALAAYHAGQANVDRWRAEGTGVQFPETRFYVRKVERMKKIYAEAYPSELGLS